MHPKLSGPLLLAQAILALLKWLWQKAVRIFHRR
jgi:hypothetical protein